MSEIEEMRNRAIDAHEIMKPMADTVDWFIDGAGGIGAIHEQNLKTVDRFAVIGYVLARDVKLLAGEVERLTAERDALKARAERAEAALIAIREWLWSGKMANAQRIGAPIVAPNNVADIVNAVFDAMPNPGEGR